MSDASRDADGPCRGQLGAWVAELRALVAAQDRLIAELRARLAANSRNSPRPPSSDGYRKLPVDDKSRKNRSLRKRSGRKAGGRDGREGVHLARREGVSDWAFHEPTACSGAAEISPMRGGLVRASAAR
ncbi:MAG: DUF6444 domain-containing protein [Solirubrobacteraceae bacterium]